MQHLFIVIEPDPIVSMDLMGALQAGYPGSTVQVVGSIAEVRAHSDLRSLRLLINSAVLSGAEPQLLNDILKRGGQIISIGGAPATGQVAATLEMPFTSEMILDAVSSVARGPHAHQPEAHT